MKLDERLKISPFNCFDIEKAKQFIGKKGWFSNRIGNFSDLNKCDFGTLGKIHDDNDSPFCKTETATLNFFFIPASLVEDKKEVFSRPFSIIEFKGHLPKMLFPDDLIHFRNKDTGFSEYAQRYNGYIVNSQSTVICLGSREYTLGDLFKNFEYLDKDGEWKPFGIKE